METLWSDTRHAARALFKRPGFTLVVTLTLALGVGANTAIFSLIYGILLRPFPYLAPDRLVKIESVYAKTTGSVQGASQLDLDDWRRHTKSFDDFGLHITYRAIPNTGGGPSQSMRLTFVTARMFETLGAGPIIGRNFKPEEDIVGGDVLKAVLSYGLWKTTFGGDRDVVGRVIRLRGATYTIIGVWAGTLTEKDHEVVRWAMQTVGAAELAHRPVGELSDGELCADIFDSARRFAPSPDVIRGRSDQQPISAIDSCP